ncbi:hypothetical protein ACP4OV_008523 [Aristida adscensionis]
MAAGASDYVFRPRDDQLVALLRRLLAGDDDGGSSFVHRADVYAAAPEDLVGGLEAAPGTAQGDGHGSVWYFFCAKKYKSAHARPGGKRHRAVGAGEACWHSEAGPRDVVGPDGGDLVVGHFVKFSYGCKTAAPAKFNRLGWCMTEYSLGDKNAAAAGGEYVLCKVYRSPRAKGKSSVSAASSTSAASTSFSAKRKASCDHPEARPTKQILYAGDSQDRQDYGNMFQDEQPRAAPEYTYGETMVETEFGLLSSVVAEVTFDELFCPSTSGACSGLPASAPPPEADFFDGLSFPSGESSSAPPPDADFFDGLSFPSGESSSMATSAPPPDADFFDGLYFPAGECSGQATSAPPPDADFFDGLFFPSGACSSLATSAPPPGPEFFEGLPACFSC